MFNRSEIMKAAWARFRRVYHFPNIAFKRIGRHCLASCISFAWQEAKAAAKVALLTVGQLATKIADLEYRLQLANLSCDADSWSTKTGAIKTELTSLRDVAANAGWRLAA
jgi:hypothetical protein